MWTEKDFEFGVRMIVLSRSFLEIVDARSILGRLVFFYKFD